MQENILITALLSFHDLLTTFKTLRGVGKDVISQICNLLS